MSEFVFIVGVQTAVCKPSLLSIQGIFSNESFVVAKVCVVVFGLRISDLINVVLRKRVVLFAQFSLRVGVVSAVRVRTILVIFDFFAELCFVVLVRHRWLVYTLVVLFHVVVEVLQRRSAARLRLIVVLALRILLTVTTLSAKLTVVILNIVISNFIISFY